MTLLKRQQGNVTQFRELVEDYSGLNAFFAGTDPDLNGMRGSIVLTDTIDREDDYLVEFFAPGSREDEFDIVVIDGIITISVTYSPRPEVEDRDRRFESISRSFDLPDDVIPEYYYAGFKNGFLWLDFQKKGPNIPEGKNTGVRTPIRIIPKS